MTTADTNSSYHVGVDLGGTKILAGVFTEDLKCIGTSKRSTKAQRGPAAVIERIARCVKDAVDECDLELTHCRGVGIGAPGAVDFDAGRVIFAPNLGWKDLPLKKELEKHLKVPVFLENDCNVCALGVHAAELDGKPRNMIGVFVGTGIGGGIILNGELHTGCGHTAAEIGHIIVRIDGPKCGCGRRGCLEAVGSRTAVIREIQKAVKAGEKTELTDILKGDISEIRSGSLRKAVKRGDKLVKKILRDAARDIGIGVASLVNVLNPEYVVLGGGVMAALEGEMFGVIRETAMEYIFPGAEKGLRIVCSELGDDAGITGAAVLARRSAK